jgi:hypothetical protein
VADELRTRHVAIKWKDRARGSSVSIDAHHLKLHLADAAMPHGGNFGSDTWLQHIIRVEKDHYIARRTCETFVAGDAQKAFGPPGTAILTAPVNR